MNQCRLSLRSKMQKNANQCQQLPKAGHWTIKRWTSAIESQNWKPERRTLKTQTTRSGQHQKLSQLEQVLGLGFEKMTTAEV